MTPAPTPCTTRPAGRSSTSAATCSTARNRPATACCNATYTTYETSRSEIFGVPHLPLVPPHQRRQPSCRRRRPRHPGHRLRAEPAADGRLSEPDRPRRRGPGLRRRAHPHRCLVRGRLADHRHGQPAHRATEVPGRLPARLRLPDPRRADGVHLPAPVRRTAPAQRGHGRREPRTEGLRRLPRQGRPLPSYRRIPRSRTGVVGGQDGRPDRRTPPGRGRQAGPGARSGPRGLLRGLLTHRR